MDGIVQPGEYAGSVTFMKEGVTVSWTFEGADASFAVSARTAGWVALGFGAGTMMEGADMAIGFAAEGGPGTASDCFSTGPTGPHPADAPPGGRQSLESSAVRESGGITVMEFRRPLAADDAMDKPVAAGDRFIWAYGESDDPGSFHAAAGAGVLASAATNARPPRTGALTFVLPHALPLALSFLAMTAGMIMARYGKKNKRWLVIHKTLGTAAAALALIGLVLGIRMVAMGGGAHLRVPHAWIATATLACSAAAPLLGQGMFWARKGKQTVRRIHRWIGRSAIILMALTIILGVMQAF